MYVCMYVCMSVCMFVCVCMYVCISMYVYVCVCMCMYACVCMHCMYVSIETHTNGSMEDGCSPHGRGLGFNSLVYVSFYSQIESNYKCT